MPTTTFDRCLALTLSYMSNYRKSLLSDDCLTASVTPNLNEIHKKYILI